MPPPVLHAGSTELHHDRHDVPARPLVEGHCVGRRGRQTEELEDDRTGARRRRLYRRHPADAGPRRARHVSADAAASAAVGPRVDGGDDQGEHEGRADAGAARWFARMSPPCRPCSFHPGPPTLRPRGARGDPAGPSTHRTLGEGRGAPHGVRAPWPPRSAHRRARERRLSHQVTHVRPATNATAPTSAEDPPIGSSVPGSSSARRAIPTVRSASPTVAGGARDPRRVDGSTICPSGATTHTPASGQADQEGSTTATRTRAPSFGGPHGNAHQSRGDAGAPARAPGRWTLGRRRDPDREPHLVDVLDRAEHDGRRGRKSATGRGLTPSWQAERLARPCRGRSRSRRRLLRRAALRGLAELLVHPCRRSWPPNEAIAPPSWPGRPPDMRARRPAGGGCSLTIRRSRRRGSISRAARLPRRSRRPRRR